MSGCPWGKIWTHPLIWNLVAEETTPKWRNSLAIQRNCKICFTHWFCRSKLCIQLFWYAESVSCLFSKKKLLSSLIHPTSSTQRSLFGTLVRLTLRWAKGDNEHAKYTVSSVIFVAQVVRPTRFWTQQPCFPLVFLWNRVEETVEEKYFESSKKYESWKKCLVLVYSIRSFLFGWTLNGSLLKRFAALQKSSFFRCSTDCFCFFSEIFWWRDNFLQIHDFQCILQFFFTKMFWATKKTLRSCI